MKRFFALILVFTCAVLAQATQTNHLDDPTGILRAADATQLEDKLADLEKDTGVRAVLRFHEQSPSPEEDNAPGVYMRGLSKKLGLIEDGVLAVYFADEKEWRVWIGNNLASRFAGRAGTSEELTKSGAMHDAKEEWMEKVFAQAEAAWSQASEAEDKVRFEASAIVDGLREKFSDAQEN